MKVKFLAVAALATFGAMSAPSYAAITPGLGSDADLALFIYDANTNTTLIQDLGAGYNSLMANPNQTLSFNIDTSNFALAAGQTWNVASVLIPDDYVNRGAVFTANTNLAGVASSISNDIQADAFTNSISSKFNNVGLNWVGSGSSLVVTDPANNAFFTKSWGNNYAGTVGFNSAQTIGGGTLNLFTLNQTPDAVSGNPTLGLAQSTSAWSINLANGTLSLASTTSAVPVPAAVWLLGSALFGFATVARREKQAA